MIRVGFVITSNKAGWLGGLHYLRTLLTAVVELGDGELEPVLFHGRRFDPEAREALPDVETHETSTLDRLRLGWVLRGAAMTLSRNDLAIAALLRRHRINAISHSGPVGRRVGPPALSWIPDFQHVGLPEFFDRKELRARDKQFRRLCDESKRVVVSSNTALADLRRFHPPAGPKARVLHFVAEPPAGGGTPQTHLSERYQLREPYLHLPNQIWAHKNHRVAVEALPLLPKEVTVVATGDTEDYRRKGLAASLVAQARNLGVGDRFRLLGRVPYADVVGLMQGCVAVLNPSLFEGWSTTVEEAKSLGKRVVLSDIPVHREQAPPGGVFFEPRNPSSLAEAVKSLLAASDPAADARLAEAAQEALPERRSDFARRYRAIVRETVAAR